MEHELGTRGRDDRPDIDDDATQAWKPADEPTQTWPGPLKADPDEAPASASRAEVPPALPPTPDRAIGRGDITPAEETDKRPSLQVRRLRRGRLAIRKIDPWAVLKFSLVFYFCMLLIFMLGTAVIFATLKAFGVIDNIESVLRNLQIDYTIAGGTIFRWFFLIGLVGTVVASAVTVFLSFLYNLIADVVGGIELLVTERE